MINVSDKQSEAMSRDCCDPMPGVFAPTSVSSVEQVKLLSAMSDATRLQIVAMLAGLDEPLCVCEIQAHFQLGQPTISHHLKVLRDASLVTWEKRGLWVYYSLNRSTLGQTASYLNNLLSLSRSALPTG